MAKRFLVLSDRIGRGDDQLGRLLMRNFLYSLARVEPRPVAVMLMNEGVRLATTGSDSLDDLRLLADAGVKVSACGTCLDFLGVKDELAVGVVGTMPDSVAALAAADDVVTIA